MTKSKWLRRALLGGAALGVMASGAQADELSALKAQLEALQSRVNTLESTPAAAQLPEGYSYLTYGKGHGSNADWANVSKTDSINVNTDRGFTISVTPTADLPAPVAEVTVYGYIKADVIFDSKSDGVPESFWVPGIDEGDKSHIHLTAHQSRFGIRSRVDTAVGQIRTQLEMDFTPGGHAGSIPLRLRHAVGHWDFAPGWTFSAGQWWNIGALLPIGITTIDWGAYAGPVYSRLPQVRLGYSSGPMSFAVAIEEPSFEHTSMPNIGASIQYDIPGGHQVVATAEVADMPQADKLGGDDLGWQVAGGANINLADMATITVGAHYGEGLVMKYLAQQNFAPNFAVPPGGFNWKWLNSSGDPLEAWGIVAGVSMPVTDTTTFNAAWGMSDLLDTPLTGNNDKSMTVHANLLWQPVSQMRLGVEGRWGRAEYNDGTPDQDAFGAQFGAWFFF